MVISLLQRHLDFIEYNATPKVINCTSGCGGYNSIQRLCEVWMSLLLYTQEASKGQRWNERSIIFLQTTPFHSIRTTTHRSFLVAALTTLARFSRATFSTNADFYPTFNTTDADRNATHSHGGAQNSNSTTSDDVN